MKNFQKWKSKKIVFVISDPGSANVILSIVKKFKLKKINFFFTNLKIKKYFINYKDKFIEIYSLKNLIKKNYFDLAIIGTGYPPKYINLANYFKTHKILTIAILDHWLNFLRRFKKNKSFFKPDVILMTHKINYRLDNFFKNIKIFNIKNYYLEQQIHEVKKIKKTKYDCCYVSDPASYIVNEKVRKKLIVDSITSFIAFIKKRKIKKVLIRPHPKDDLCRFKNMIKGIAKKKEYNYHNLVISKSKNISKDIGSSNAIFGMKSFGLFISLQTKKRVYCFQKNNSNFKLIKKSDQL
jgi:hypothetical protein